MSNSFWTDVHWCPQIAGVVNVTPDSFSGDGLFRAPDRAAERAVRLVSEGAAMIDVGGESTRPGATPVSIEEESSRVLPALREISKSVNVPISIDTSKAEVARRAIAEGATVVNDVSGLREPSMAGVVAEAGAGLVVVHGFRMNLGDNLTSEVATFLRQKTRAAVDSGIRADRILIDPGLGLGKTWLENFALMKRLGSLVLSEFPMMIGPSRKGMIARVLGEGDETRLDGTLALVAICVANGARVLRVHDVRQMAPVVALLHILVDEPDGATTALVD